MNSLSPGFRARLFVVLLFPSIFGAVSPVSGALSYSDGEGYYRDPFADSSGLAVRQNVVVGPSLISGVRLALSNWSWAQSYTPASDAVYTPFSDSRARANLTMARDNSATDLWDDDVTLWQREFQAGRDFVLHPSVVSTTIFNTPVTGGRLLAKMAGMETISEQFMLEGPFENDLAPGKGYTVTFKALTCDDPGCVAPMAAAGLEVARFDVFFGTAFALSPVRLGGYSGSSCAGGAGNFICTGTGNSEGTLSPVTLEWAVPLTPPSGQGWQYRVRSTLDISATTTLWIDTVRVMAKGFQIDPKQFKLEADCPGQKPCNNQCIDIDKPCGWDAATWYVDTGSYVSPVFDSLSENTEWATIWWRVAQNFNNDAGVGTGWPKTPVSIKWRVGDSPDPSTWLSSPMYFNWTIPMSVTCSGERDCTAGCSYTYCNCNGKERTVVPCPPPYPPPLGNIGEAILYVDGSSVKAVGRYFQYEVDFTSHFANNKYPPEQDLSLAVLVREFHDTPSPRLKAIRVFYKPARGMVVSGVIAPSQLKKWKAVNYTADLSSGGSVQVDVLDENFTPLFTNIPPGFSLEGLDPKQYPRLRLRGYVDSGGNPDLRPNLKSWELLWDSLTEYLRLDRNLLDISRGDRVTVTVVLGAARAGSITVHDVSGQLVKELMKGTIPLGMSVLEWDGTNGKGERVVSGVYFLSLKAKEVRRVARVAVVR